MSLATPVISAAVWRRRNASLGRTRRTKYGAKGVKLDWLWFASQREARYWQSLQPLLRSGALRLALPQVPFRLPGGTVYRADFLLWWSDGRVEFVDVKGYRTSTYVVKRKAVEALWGIEILER